MKLLALAALLTTTLAGPCCNTIPASRFQITLNVTQAGIGSDSPPNALVPCTLNQLCTVPADSDVMVAGLAIVPDSGTNKVNTNQVECRLWFEEDLFQQDRRPTSGFPFDVANPIGIATNPVNFRPVLCYLRQYDETISGPQ